MITFMALQVTCIVLILGAGFWVLLDRISTRGAFDE